MVVKWKEMYYPVDECAILKERKLSTQKSANINVRQTFYECILYYVLINIRDFNANL